MIDARTNHKPDKARELIEAAILSCNPPTQIELAARMGITRQHLFHMSRGSRVMAYEFQVMLEGIIAE